MDDVADQGSLSVMDGPMLAPSLRERGGVQSVARALTLLEIIADFGGEAALTQIAAKAGLNVSTCHHLLSTLVAKGYVARVPDRRSYALGARLVYLSQVCLRRVDLPRRAEPFVERVSAATGETVHLAVLQADSVFKLLIREARHAVRVDTGTMGKSDAVHATATGKAILAWLPEDDIRRIVSVQGMKRLTSHTITDLDALIEELVAVRRHGVAMDREEFLTGVVCIAAAIRDRNGAVVGSIGASMPAMRADDEHVRVTKDQVVSAARGLSGELGEPDAQYARFPPADGVNTLANPM
jgi:IclR family transcriptional regulator, acetate operon repressor